MELEALGFPGPVNPWRSTVNSQPELTSVCLQASLKVLQAWIFARLRLWAAGDFLTCRSWHGVMPSTPASRASRFATNHRGKFRPKPLSRCLDLQPQDVSLSAEGSPFWPRNRKVLLEGCGRHTQGRVSLACGNRTEITKTRCPRSLWEACQAGMDAQRVAVVLPVFQRPEGLGFSCVSWYSGSQLVGVGRNAYPHSHIPFQVPHKRPMTVGVKPG